MSSQIAEKMLKLLSILFIVSAIVIDAQVPYSRVISYDPRYLIRRVPVRRSAEVNPRIRMPLTRYFPQVDTQVAPAPYIPQEAIAPAAYQLANGEIYAIPSKWADDVIPLSALERNDENEYDTYDYDNEYAPTYARNYPKEADRDVDGDLYNELMVNYLLGGMQPTLDDGELTEVERRSEGMAAPFSRNKNDGDDEVISKHDNATKGSTTKSTTSAPVVSSTVGNKPSPAGLKVSTPIPPMTSRKTSQQSFNRRSQNKYVMAPRSMPLMHGMWRDFNADVHGQKEYPLYRPVAESPMASLESQMSRSKSSPKNKDALPIIEKLMSAAHKSEDPAKDQLDSLKFRNM